MSDIIHKNRYRFILTLMAGLILLFLLFIIIPRKGFDFTDHGYYLYNGWLIKNGIIPSAGYAGVINAVFMMIGLGNYLILEIVYMCLGCISILVTWLAFREWHKSVILPLILLASISAQNISTISSYQNVPIYFLVLGFGFFYMYLDENAYTRNVSYLVVSALMLSFACFVNISLLPVLLVILTGCVVMIHFTSDKRPYWFSVLIILFSAVLFLMYANSPLSLIGISAKSLELKTSSALSFVGYINKFWIFFLGFYLKSTVFLTWAIVSILARWFSYRYQKPFYSQFVYVFASWVSLLSLNYNTTLFFFYLPIITLISFFRKDVFYYRLVVLTLVIFASSVCFVLTTNGTPLSHILYFLPGYMLVVGLIIDKEYFSGGVNFILTYSMAAFVLIFSSIIIYNYIYALPYRAFPITSKKHEIHSGLLKGVWANNGKIKAVSYVLNSYRAYGCKNKSVMFFPAMPLFYYLLHRHAYKDIPWISPAVSPFLKQEELIKHFSNTGHWCVFYAPDFNWGAGSTYNKFIAYIGNMAAFQGEKIIPHSKKLQGIYHPYYPAEIRFYEK